MFNTHATTKVILPRLIRRSAVSMGIYPPSPSVNQVSSNCKAGSLICLLCFDLALCTVPHMLFLRNIANTTLPSGTTFESGSSFSYTCMQDYQPAIESATVQCDKHAQLSHEAQCVPISCKQHPPTIDNGRTIFHSTKHGSVAKYRCLPGYQMENNLLTKATCQFGQWLPKQPSKCLPSRTANLCPLWSKFEFSAHSQCNDCDKVFQCATAYWRWEILESPAGQISHYHICILNILSFFLRCKHLPVRNFSWWAVQRMRATAKNPKAWGDRQFLCKWRKLSLKFQCRSSSRSIGKSASERHWPSVACTDETTSSSAFLLIHCRGMG